MSVLSSRCLCHCRAFSTFCGTLATLQCILRPRENPKIDWRVDPDINGISEVRSFRVLTWTEYSNENVIESVLKSDLGQTTWLPVEA